LQTAHISLQKEIFTPPQLYRNARVPLGSFGFNLLVNFCIPPIVAMLLTTKNESSWHRLCRIVVCLESKLLRLDCWMSGLCGAAKKALEWHASPWHASHRDAWKPMKFWRDLDGADASWSQQSNLLKSDGTLG